MSDLNDKPEVCFDHPSPSFLVALLNAGGKLDLLLRGQQRCWHDLSEVNLNAGLRIVSHAPTSPQIGSEATAGFDNASLIYFVSASAARCRPQSPRSPRVRGELRSLAIQHDGFSSTG